MSNQPRVVTNSIAAIAAGFGAFFAAGGVVFGAMYVILPYLLPKPEGVARLAEGLYVLWCWLFGAVAGSTVGGYVTSRVAKRNQFIHSAVVIAMLVVPFWWIFWPGKYLDAFALSIEAELTVAACLFFLLGTWIGSRKRKQIERSE
jgi:Na+-driven multidrug efflux pump